MTDRTDMPELPQVRKIFRILPQLTALLITLIPCAKGLSCASCNGKGKCETKSGCMSCYTYNFIHLPGTNQTLTLRECWELLKGSQVIEDVCLEVNLHIKKNPTKTRTCFCFEDECNKNTTSDFNPTNITYRNPISCNCHGQTCPPGCQTCFTWEYPGEDKITSCVGTMEMLHPSSKKETCLKSKSAAGKVGTMCGCTTDYCNGTPPNPAPSPTNSAPRIVVNMLSVLLIVSCFMNL